MDTFSSVAGQTTTLPNLFLLPDHSQSLLRCGHCHKKCIIWWIILQILSSNNPVLNAGVEMKISVESLSGNVVSLTQGTTLYPLHDNGNGGKHHNQRLSTVTVCLMPDPDLMAGDGIYSRYLTRYPLPGRYRVVVIMKNMAGSAYTVASQEQLYPQPSGLGPFKALKLNIWIPIIPLLGHYLVIYLVWEIISETSKYLIWYLIWLKFDSN